MSKIAIIGAGSWGKALAALLTGNGHAVELYGRDRAQLNLDKTDAILISTPSQVVRSVAQSVLPALSAAHPITVISTSKGIEADTGKTMLTLLSEELPKSSRLVVLSGPSFAAEVTKGLPTAVTVASTDDAAAAAVATLFHNERFRVYTSKDVTGVELCGVLKNVLALAAGVCDGLNMGLNARAALITRGLAEMSRYVIASGGDSKTVFGLSGVGDLLLTATGDLSRNRRVGLGLATGKNVSEVLAEIGQTAEAVNSAPTLVRRAKQLNVELPICSEVTRLLNQEITAVQAVANLLSRSKKEE